MSFTGFSEDDIRKLITNQEINTNDKGKPKPLSGKKISFKPTNTKNNDQKLKKNLTHKSMNNVIEELPDNAKLSTVTEAKETDTKNEETKNKEIIENNNLENKDTQEITAELVTDNIKIDKKPVDLEEFEAKQKLIEEQNRRRKELLAKALADRTKQTQEESQRLNEIQVEFKKLDDMLSNDVKILRKKIELASIEYTDCQKRYHKVEKEFLEAKLLLHQKLEKKEMLTEHLCAIIEKNEERKAEKLTELLQKLQINPQFVNGGEVDGAIEE